MTRNTKRKRFLSTLPARGATWVLRLHHRAVDISIHAPREGSDTRGVRRKAVLTVFLSTLPARGATSKLLGASRRALHFYPRSPRGERQLVRQDEVGPGHISIHAPREGSDSRPARIQGKAAKFLSTLPARGATFFRAFSIPKNLHFYPRSPRGERHDVSCNGTWLWLISIHAPREGSDDSVYAQYLWAIGISIHAPREGSDVPGQRYFLAG